MPNKNNITAYTLIRSRRKTLSLRITREGTVEVRAPLRLAKSEINHFVASKQDWINKHILAQLAKNEKRKAFALHDGGEVIIRGTPCRIQVVSGGGLRFDGEHVFLPNHLTLDERKEALICLYRTLAKTNIQQRIAFYAEKTKLIPSAVHITGAKTRWGSCSGKNSINFTWRLMMACDEVIDYVVVHELAHIKEHNHSIRFWAVVAGVLPDYTERQVMLRELQLRLSNENW